MRLGIIGVAVVGMAVLMSTSWGRTSGQEGQRGCTVTVEPGQSVQKAIDEAPEGAVVCLSEGTWREHVRIQKSLTLKGAGPGKTRIQGPTLDDPVIDINTEPVKRVALKIILEELSVTLEGAVEIGIDPDIDAGGIHIWAPNSQITISNVQIIQAFWFGLATGGAHVEVQDVEISDNLGVGIAIREGLVIIRRARIANNGTGLYASGVYVGDKAQIRVEQTTISNNHGSGIEVSDAVQLWLERSTVSSNGNDGLTINGFVSHEVPQVRIISSQIEGNGTDENCQKPGPRDFEICNGIEVISDAQLVLSTDTGVTKNADWGIAAWSQACGYQDDRLGAQVLLEGDVVNLRGNNRSGNHASNWGHHLGQHPDYYIEPGNVCLPPPPPPECTASLWWSDTPIQPIIDSAPPGATICLLESADEVVTWYENITITKSLTLKGAGPEKTIIRAAKPGQPVIRIQGNSPIEVRLEGISLQGAISPEVANTIYCKDPCDAYGLAIGGQAHVSIKNILVTENDLHGIVISGSAIVKLEESTISKNQWTGLTIWDSARVSLANVRLAENLGGLAIAGDARLEARDVKVINNRWVGLYLSGNGHGNLEDSSISGSLQGVVAIDRAQLALTGTEISRNRQGFKMADSSLLMLEDSAILENAWWGIEARDWAIVIMRGGQVKANGSDQACVQLSQLCPGIAARDQAQLLISGVEISGNGSWGVAAWLKQCGYHEDDFNGHVSIVGEEMIKGNNIWGKEHQREICLP